ncbi:sialate:O-sulfotransferase 1-like [Mytilus galloprovincialis]|uniref:sialate:O-sulfotransferase 1-like n=1 Tax=Mytilus galloprovincialis TaxID=29158 RepID=UPI003F7BB80D
MLRKFILICILLVDLVISQKCQIQVLGSFDYLGCFVDNPVRLLPHGYNGDGHYPKMENNRCILFCKGQGFKYAGTEATSFCFCGNTVKDFYTQNYECNEGCLGDSTQICGGQWRLSVYETGYLPLNSRNISLTQLKKDYKLTTQTKKAVKIRKGSSSVLGCAMHCLVLKTCKVFEVLKETGECSVLNDFESLCEGFQYAVGYSIFMLM